MHWMGTVRRASQKTLVCAALKRHYLTLPGLTLSTAQTLSHLIHIKGMRQKSATKLRNERAGNQRAFTPLT